MAVLFNNSLRTHLNLRGIRMMRALGLWTVPTYINADYPVYSLTVAASVANYNVRALLDVILGFNNADPFFLVKVHLNAAVIISSATPGTPAFSSGTINAAAIIQITGDAGAQIVGAGGIPGAGGNTASKPGNAGGKGGDAIKANCLLFVDFKLLAPHAGGGGGGGGALLDTGAPAPSPPVPPPTPPTPPTPPPNPPPPPPSDPPGMGSDGEDV